MKRRDFLKCLPFLALPLFGSPLFANNKRICIVLDDIGSNKSTVPNLELLAEKEIPITTAIIPQSLHEKNALRILSQYENADILLHQPMEPQDMKERNLERNLERNIRGKKEIYNPAKHTAIYSWDHPQLVQEIVHNNLNNLNDYLEYNLNSNKRIIGLNNHMGSLVTQSETLMTSLAQYALDKSLILLDSKTTHHSVMYTLGQEIGVKTHKNRSFIDKDTLTLLNRYYKSDNPVILIGHIQNKSTLDACIQFSKEHNLARLSEL